MRKAAEMMRDAIAESKPNELGVDGWHLPFVGTQELLREYELRDDDVATERSLCMFSAARCARVSLVRQDERKSSKDEIAMAEKLMKSGHYSPFEHQAQALPDVRRCANLRGWLSFRSTIPNEDNFAKTGGANA
jgi:hypothetical protein